MVVEGEKMVMFDDVEWMFILDDLLIINGVLLLCIVGVFGGKDFGVLDDMQVVLFEVVFFQFVFV